MPLWDTYSGHALALLSALSFAAANLFVARTTVSGGDKGVMFSICVTVAMSGLLWLAIEAGSTRVEMTPGAWLGVIWFAVAGLFAMVFGRSLVFESIRRLGVPRASAVKRLNPFFAVLLAGLILAEPLTAVDKLGMAAIAVAFGLLIGESFRGSGGIDTAPPATAYLFGIFGALSYAFAYVLRKLGLELLPAPALGTLVSAVTGLAVFMALSIVSGRYRGYLGNVVSHLDRWIVGAAIMVSIGQILLFAALALAAVSTVVMIASLEIFFSIFLSVVVLRSERTPSAAVLGAAGLAMIGVVLVSAG